ncbi:unnamed protein product [Cochlearia groenlandica]
MAVSTISSLAPISAVAGKPASLSAAIWWKQPYATWWFRFLRRRRKKKKPRVISCAYSCREVRDVCYRPPGGSSAVSNGCLLEAFLSLFHNLSFCSFGLIFGKTGSGKTTLLQLLAGLNKPTSGSNCIQRYGDDGQRKADPELLPTEKVGIVFQRDSLLQIICLMKLLLVGLDNIPLDKDPQLLSGGYKCRLALVQTPDLLIQDKPLAGLVWKALADVAKLLKHLKKELNLLVRVSSHGRPVMENGNRWRSSC